jgi:hypothetical protein
MYDSDFIILVAQGSIAYKNYSYPIVSFKLEEYLNRESLNASMNIYLCSL